MANAALCLPAHTADCKPPQTQKRHINEVDLVEEPLEKRTCLDELKEYVVNHSRLLLREVTLLIEQRNKDHDEKQNKTFEKLIAMVKAMRYQVISQNATIKALQSDVVLMRNNIRTTYDPEKFPLDQQASRTDILGSISLLLALLREIEKPHRTPNGIEPGVKLHYGGWKSIRNLFGRRALQLRLADHARGLCAQPRLWARGGPNDNAGVRYIFSADEAESCVRRILQQRYNAHTTVHQQVRHVIETTEPGEWPANDVDIEPEWQRC